MSKPLIAPAVGLLARGTGAPARRWASDGHSELTSVLRTVAVGRAAGPGTQ